MRLVDLSITTGAVLLIAGLTGAPSLASATHPRNASFSGGSTILVGDGGITTGPDGALWFNGESAIDRISTSGVATVYTSNGIMGTDGITVGPDKALWFTDLNNSIGRITPGGAVTIYTSPEIRQPEGIVTGPDGALWFTNVGNNSIGRITTSGRITDYTGPGIDNPRAITAGPDGALWFTNEGSGLRRGSIGRITTSGKITIYTNPDIDFAEGITTGPDGALWFASYGNFTIGRVTTGGQFSFFSGSGTSSGSSGCPVDIVPQCTDSPRNIVAGPDGALWFTNSDNNTIGRITTSGQATDYTGPGIDTPWGITPGPDGALWFTNAGNNSIGRITTAGVVTNYSLTGASTPPTTAPTTTTTPGSKAKTVYNPILAGWVLGRPANEPVSARVTLPHVSCNTAGEVALWVGYDGLADNTVEQDGVTASCSSAGSDPKYQLWYELYKSTAIFDLSGVDGMNWYQVVKHAPHTPAATPNPVPVKLPVSLKWGDYVDLFVNRISPSRIAGVPLGRDEIFFSIAVYNGGGDELGYWSKPVVEPLAFSPKYNSSECILETPTVVGKGPVNLPEFSAVTFTNCSAIDEAAKSSDLVPFDIETAAHRS